jgi:excisionase family DNA binding protein
MVQYRLSVAEISTLLGGNPDTIYQWVTRKGMLAQKVGRLRTFLASEVDEWVKTGVARKESTCVPAPKESEKRRRNV